MHRKASYYRQHAKQLTARTIRCAAEGRGFERSLKPMLAQIEADLRRGKIPEDEIAHRVVLAKQDCATTIAYDTRGVDVVLGENILDLLHGVSKDYVRAGASQEIADGLESKLTDRLLGVVASRSQRPGSGVICTIMRQAHASV